MRDKNIVKEEEGIIIMNLFTIIREWVTFAADICILAITIYTFYITFISQRIKFISLSNSSSNSKGDSFAVVLENKSLSPQVINDIYMIIDNKYKIQVKKFEVPLILEPYKAMEISSEKYSYTTPSLPLKTGLMTGEILGYNGIPEDALNSMEDLSQHLDNWLKPNGLNYYINQLKGSFIEESVNG